MNGYIMEPRSSRALAMGVSRAIIVTSSGASSTTLVGLKPL